MTNTKAMLAMTLLTGLARSLPVLAEGDFGKPWPVNPPERDPEQVEREHQEREAADAERIAAAEAKRARKNAKRAAKHRLL